MMNDYPLDIFGRLLINTKQSAFDSRIVLEKCITGLLSKSGQSFTMFYDYDVLIFRIGTVHLRLRTNTSFKKSSNTAPYSSITTFVAYGIGELPVKVIKESIFSRKLKVPVRSIVKKFIKKAKST